MKLWRLELMDGTSIDMPDAAAQMAKTAMGRGDKFISLPDRVIALHQIKTLDKTSTEDTSGKKLLGQGLNAFKGDVTVLTDKNGYHSVSAVKVKKEVSQREYSSYYSKHPAYEPVKGEQNSVSFWIAKDLGIPEGCALA